MTYDKGQFETKIRAMVELDKYQPAGGTTKCNYFLQDVAHDLFNYSKLAGMLATPIVNYIGQSPDWKVFYDRPITAAGGALPPKPDATLEAAFAKAVQLMSAAQVSLVVFGYGPSSGDGHVAVAFPGALEQSGNWSVYAPHGVPHIAQAGEDVDVMKLSEGFSTKRLEGGRFLVAQLL